MIPENIDIQTGALKCCRQCNTHDAGRQSLKLSDERVTVSPYSFMFAALEENRTAGVRAGDTHLVVTITGDLNARLPHLHVHNQTFHHW